MHGGHQVSQKLSTTGLPRNWSSATVRWESVMVNSGAALPMRGGCAPLLHAASNIRQTRTLDEKERFTLI
jgi:hypothetical protein